MISYKNILILDHLEETWLPKPVGKACSAGASLFKTSLGAKRTNLFIWHWRTKQDWSRSKITAFRIYIVRNFGLPLSLGSHIWKCLTQWTKIFWKPLFKDWWCLVWHPRIGAAQRLGLLMLISPWEMFRSMQERSIWCCCALGMGLELRRGRGMGISSSYLHSLLCSELLLAG